jgi:hypothetical protein
MSHYDREQYLTPENIKKYEKKDVNALLKKAREVFHAWIRERDRDGDYFTCISCQRTKKIEGDQYHAGHYYSAGNHNALRFMENNVHGQCKQCNYFLSGNQIGYRENLIKKIGKGGYEELTFKAALSKRKTKKWSRFELIEIIEKYK